MKAELIINGPKGQAFAELEVQEDGSILACSIEAAAAHAGNLYNELEVQKPVRPFTSRIAYGGE